MNYRHCMIKPRYLQKPFIVSMRLLELKLRQKYLNVAVKTGG